MTQLVNVRDVLTDAFIERLDSLLVNEMIRTRAPGLSIGIIQGDELVFTRNYGAINIEENKPATSDSLYMIASITKSFTASGVLKLVEAGKLSLDDKLSDFIPLNLGFTDDPIRIKHMLTHSTGIPNFADLLSDINHEDMYGMSMEIPKVPWSSWDDIFRALKGLRSQVTEKPGQRFYYNNLVYDLLGKIIEDVSGTKFADFINKEILSPLGMKHSSFYNENLARDPNLATPYFTGRSGKLPKLMAIKYPENRFISAAGGLFSSVNDMAKYLIMHVHDGAFNGKQILPKDLIHEMHSMQFKEKYPNTPFESFYGNYGKTGYGYGLVIHTDFFKHTLIEHSGSYLGASSWMAFIPELQLGVIFLSNHHPSPRMFAQVLLMELLGKDSKKYHPLLRLRAHHAKLVGKYQSYMGIVKGSVISRGGTLFLKSDAEGPEMPLIPADKTPIHKQLNYYVFTEIGGKMPVQFTIDKKNTWLHYERLKLQKIK